MVLYENARWLKDRFQSMGPAEALSRLADVGRHGSLRASLKILQSRPNKRFEQTNPLRRPAGIQNQLGNISTRAREPLIATASRWLEHRASFFSLKDVCLGHPINWHRDYSSSVIAPIRYTGFINPRDRSKVGDIKYIWELNRFQHLVLLALARLWTKEAKYWVEIERQVVSWKKSNPFMMGVNWKSPLETGLRLISWAYVSFLSTTWNKNRKACDHLFAETVYHHQYFIRKFFSKHSSANNHLIGEMAGLYVASLVWPWYRESTAWRSFARRKLIQEIVRQVEPDGVGCERTIEYQLFVFELFLLAGALGQAVGDPFPPEYWNRIGRMAGFLSAISNRAGDLPMFGDGDSGQVIRLPETIRERSRVLVRIGQCDESIVSRDLRSILLLWGQSPKEIPIDPANSLPPSLQVFPDGGYCVLAADRGSENEILSVFDAGPLGLPPLNAHGHADALSFCLSYGGREFLIDPGTYCYQSMTDWRSYFRGTAAHNTVRIDGVDQSIICGPFLWREAANCRIEETSDTGELIEVVASHDGYRRLEDTVVHRRSLRLYKKSRLLIVADRLDCQRSHRVELFFHFSEKCQVGQSGPNCFEALNGDKRIRLVLDSRLRPELYRGSQQPISGWVSRQFGVKEPTFTLVARGVIAGATQFVTEISAV
jgi:hypothetical protein